MRQTWSHGASDRALDSFRSRLRGRLRATLYAGLDRLGLEVTRSERLRWRNALSNLDDCVHYVVDVGAGGGTPYLYDALPSAELLLIEPLEEFGRLIGEVLNGRSGAWLQTAAGDGSSDAVSFTVFPHDLLKSGQFERTETVAVAGARHRLVPTTTVDAVVQKCCDGAMERDLVLKIDAEGAELAVLRGAETSLARVRALVVEASVAPRFVGSYSLAELVKYLAERGLHLSDILQVSRKRGSLIHADLVFMPAD